MEDNLKKYMANLHVLIHNALNFHWNVTGGLFLTLHELFQHQYDFFFKQIDILAELMKGRNMLPPITLPEIENLADLELFESKDYTARDTLEIQLKQFQFMLDLSNKLSTFYGEQHDLALEDFFIDMSKFLGKHLYFLRQILKQ
ncbi:MAG: Ferritin Dps family protein [Haloplasmataceae bacterium]|jgi:starvation-inducible DNA-binding protein|nr:Ferritin Dps family protein [Haloplasmataceae bacterium]